MRAAIERDRLLSWLGQVLRRGDAVEVDVVVIDRPDQQSSVQITLSNVEGPLGGLEVGAARGRSISPGNPSRVGG